MEYKLSVFNSLHRKIYKRAGLSNVGSGHTVLNLIDVVYWFYQTSRTHNYYWVPILVDRLRHCPHCSDLAVTQPSIDKNYKLIDGGSFL